MKLLTKILIWFFRILMGLTFIFSGVVKANDPLGLTYKMQEFFDVLGMGFMSDMAFTFSILMIAFEIIAGVAVLVGSSFRLYITLMLLLNIFYTFLTGYALFSGKVKECGCFGDCFKISNDMTFYKDILLTLISVYLVWFRHRVFPIFPKVWYNSTVIIIALLFSFGFQWWTLMHLPVHDCLPYRVGSNLQQKMLPAPDATDAVYETVLTYSKNGVKKDFPSDKIPWQDKSWEYVSTQTKLIKEATGQPEIHDFVLSDSAGNDVTKDVLNYKGYTFLWFTRNLDQMPMKDKKPINMDRIAALSVKAQGMKMRFYMLASIDTALCKTLLEAWDVTNIPYLSIDGTVNKTAMRTNPGLMLLHDGVVEQKWSYLDYPTSMELSGNKLIFK
jgi:uncharacterized membrane protein YphA (DoxX/SURF4 family)